MGVKLLIVAVAMWVATLVLSQNCNGKYYGFTNVVAIRNSY